jgi:uncharacterized surface protein with fasciclin (FAS1) repeats
VNATRSSFTPSTVRVLGLVLLLGVPALACSDDVADGPTTTVPASPDTSAAPTTTAVVAAEPFDIVGTALTAGVFSQLAGMVVDAGLTATLRSEGPFTVFAPTNAAFEALPLDALHGVQDDPETLATVLTYHVVAGALTAADLKDGQLETVSGLNLTVSHQGDDVLINGVPIAAPDVIASNGVIHVMGEVLLPPG